MHYLMTLLLPVTMATVALVWKINEAEKTKQEKGGQNEEKEEGENEKEPANNLFPPGLIKRGRDEELNIGNSINGIGKQFILAFTLPVVKKHSAGKLVFAQYNY